MFERYGFYVIQALIVLYLTKKMSFQDREAYTVLGNFVAISYIMTVFGGYLADLILGYRHAIILGGLLLFVGYTSLSLANTPEALYVALAIVCIGTGLFKANISSFLGSIYHANDPRKDSGYTIFYIGISIGVTVSTAVSGYLVKYFNWHSAFISAALLIIIGTSFFIIFSKKYGIYDKREITKNAIRYTIAYGLILLVLGLCVLLMFFHTVSIFFFYLICFIAAIVLYKAAKKRSILHQKRIIAFAVLLLFSTLFWAIYFQMFFSINLYISRLVNHNILGFSVPTPFFASLESIGIIVFGGIVSKLWQHMDQRKSPPSIALKLCIGLSLLTLTFFVLYVGLALTGANHLVSPLWVIGAYLILSVSELCFSPISLSMVTKLIPQEFRGVMMGILFVSAGIGGELAGAVAKFSDIPHQFIKSDKVHSIYMHAFSYYGLTALVTTILLGLMMPLMKKLLTNHSA